MECKEPEWRMYAKKADFQAIGQKYGIDPVIARVMRNRDIVEDSAIARFLNGSLRDVHDPASMADIDVACDLLMEKIEHGKTIRIVSDYDVDGVTSNYILYDALKRLQANVSYEIPHRVYDGYGINERIIEDAHKDGIDTIITCDNGIAAFPAIELAKSYGMTVIVTDHHEVPYHLSKEGERIYDLVPADAVVDIKRADCNYPFKGICGAVVAYKVMRHLYRRMNVSWEDEERYIEILAIATQCDVMDLIDENRIYVKEGLKILQRTKNLGLQALIRVNELSSKKIMAYHLGFVLGPCINAAGRLDSAKPGVELLCSETVAEAEKRATLLRGMNLERKQLTEDGVKEGIRYVEEHLGEDHVLVVYMPNLHESIAGIVAGKIREAFYRPVLVVTDSESGMLKGSGRSIDGYHMYDALTECKHLLAKFGGHELAAGFSLPKENLQAFHDALNDNEQLTDDELTEKIYIDVPMPMGYVTRKLIDDLDVLEPFGKSNEKPVFAQAGLGIKRVRLLHNGDYAKITFSDNEGRAYEGMEYNANAFLEKIKMWFGEQDCDRILKGMPNNVCLDVSYYPGINDYQGLITLQMNPKMYRKHFG